MGSHHSHNHNSQHGISNITIAFFLNLSFTIIEIIGGILTNSLAILSDALHDLGDSLSLGLSWYMEKVSRKKRDRNFSYGYKRFSLLAALINGIVLVAGSIIILLEAVPRLFSPEPVAAQGMVYLAILGIAANGAAVWRVKRGNTMNEKVIAWHLLEDVLGWVGILIIGLVMMFGELPILDPLFSIIFTAYILWNVFKNLKQTVMIFLQSIPDNIDIPDVENRIFQNTGVESIHDTHVWSLDGAYHILTTHVVVGENLSQKEIISLKGKIKADIARFKINHATIEIERVGEKCILKHC